MSKEKKKNLALWLIRDQEEQGKAVIIAKTEGGSLAKYEKATGVPREEVRSERVSFVEDVLRLF